MTQFHSPNLLPEDGDVRFYERFFDEKDSNRYLNLLLNEIAWKQQPIRLYGKEIMQPRLTAWCADHQVQYSYSGVTLTTQPWTSSLLEIKQRIENVARVQFNGCLLNQYRSGKDSMGWHRDDEKELGPDPTIGSVSLGATRTFQMRHRDKKTLKRSFELTHGSFLVMSGVTQKYWDHNIPKRIKTMDLRINLTFRTIIDR